MQILSKTILRKDPSTEDVLTTRNLRTPLD